MSPQQPASGMPSSANMPFVAQQPGFGMPCALPTPAVPLALPAPQPGQSVVGDQANPEFSQAEAPEQAQAHSPPRPARRELATRESDPMELRQWPACV